MWEPPTESKDGGETLKDQLERTQAKFDKLSSSLRRYSKPWYEELMIAWIHLKVIRVFVESVLNFGVPANFQTALIDCKTAKDSLEGDSCLRGVCAKLWGPSQL